MHILFCVNKSKFGTKCFVKREQFVLPFINGNEDKQVYVCSKRLVCISCEVVYEKSETRLDERVCVFVTTKEGRVTNK